MAQIKDYIEPNTHIMEEEAKIELSAIEFIRLIQEGEAMDVNGNLIESKPVPFQNEMVRYIHKILVKEDIKLGNLECLDKIHILDCTLKSIWIEGCHFKSGLKIEFCDIQQDIGTKDTTINKEFAIRMTTILRDLNICWKSFFENFLIDSECIIEGGFYINNAEITNDFKIFYTTIKKRFHIHNKCVIQGHLIIDHLVGVDLKISDTKVLNEVRIWYSTFSESVDVSRSNLYGLNILSLSAFDFSSFQTTIEDRFIIQHETVLKGNIHIIDTTVNGELIINDVDRKNLSIIQCILNIWHVSSMAANLTMNISNTSFNKIEAIGGINLGYIRWNNLIPKTNAIIEIENALMGKWDIVNCNFEDVAMIIYSSKITDVFYTNTKFPKTLESPKRKSRDQSNGKMISHEDLENKHDILRDGYNQLKTIAQKQNDRKLFLHYQAAELSSYYETLHWWRNFRTKFQLGAMRMSNNYGTSWGLGFAFVIISNFIFVSIAYSQRGWLLNKEGLGIYFSGYLSSIFSLITVPKYFETTWEVNWFYFSRLFIAFGIYQTIAAFRKFGKSE
jgi:hypothetical protein